MTLLDSWGLSHKRHPVQLPVTSLWLGTQVQLYCSPSARHSCGETMQAQRCYWGAPPLTAPRPGSLSAEAPDSVEQGQATPSVFATNSWPTESMHIRNGRLMPLILGVIVMQPEWLEQMPIQSLSAWSEKKGEIKRLVEAAPLIIVRFVGPTEWQVRGNWSSLVAETFLPPILPTNLVRSS